MYDIAIIGAGPAGSTLARLTGRRMKVLILDRRELHRDPETAAGRKPCGGLLAPDAQKIMARLGLGLPEHVIAGPQLFVVKTVDMQSGLERFYQRFYLNIDREKFDRWLLSLVPAGVEMRSGHTLKGFEEAGDGVRITVTGDGKKYTEHAKVLVGADGAASMVRRRILPPGRKGPAEYIAVQEHFHGEHIEPYFSVFFDRDITDFYSWIIPKGDTLILGAALVPGKVALQRFELLKEKLRRRGYRFADPLLREGALILRPARASHIFAGRGNVMLAGEAAGLISPSSAEGLSYAMRSAAAAAEVLVQGHENAVSRYRRALTPLRMNIMLKNIKSPFMYVKWLRNLVMRSRLKHIDVKAETQ